MRSIEPLPSHASTSRSNGQISADRASAAPAASMSSSTGTPRATRSRSRGVRVGRGSAGAIRKPPSGTPARASSAGSFTSATTADMSRAFSPESLRLRSLRSDSRSATNAWVRSISRANFRCLRATTFRALRIEARFSSAAAVNGNAMPSTVRIKVGQTRSTATRRNKLNSPSATTLIAPHSQTQATERR